MHEPPETELASNISGIDPRMDGMALSQELFVLRPERY
jgi:hypothetical protein